MDDDGIPERVVSIPLKQFLQSHPNLISDIFGHNLRDNLELSSLRSVRLPGMGWRAILLPARIDTLDATLGLLEGTKWEGDCDWEGGVDWLAVLLSVHWSRPAPYIYAAKVDLFRRGNSEIYGNEPVAKLLAMSRVITYERTEPKPILFSDLLVDPGGEWGLIECQDEHFSLLLANENLFDRFVSVLGGMDLIQQRAEEQIRLRAGWEADRNPAVSPDGLNEIYLSFFRPVYDRIGWPWPFAEYITMERYGLSDD